MYKKIVLSLQFTLIALILAMGIGAVVLQLDNYIKLQKQIDHYDKVKVLRMIDAWH